MTAERRNAAGVKSGNAAAAERGKLGNEEEGGEEVAIEMATENAATLKVHHPESENPRKSLLLKREMPAQCFVCSYQLELDQGTWKNFSHPWARSATFVSSQTTRREDRKAFLTLSSHHQTQSLSPSD